MRLEQERYTVVFTDNADFMTDGEGRTATFNTPHDAELAGIDSGRDYEVVNLLTEEG